MLKKIITSTFSTKRHLKNYLFQIRASFKVCPNSEAVLAIGIMAINFNTNQAHRVKLPQIEKGTIDSTN